MSSLPSNEQALLHTKLISKFRRINFLPWLMCLLAAFFYCYEYLLRIAPSTMAAELELTFNITHSKFGLLSTFYFFAYTPMQLPVGIMMDKYGPRRILTAAVFCCAIGTAIMGMTQFFSIALVGRFLLGFGSAFAFVGVLKLATIWLPANRFAMIAGLTTTLGMLGAVFGQNILKTMVIHTGWEDTVFYAGLIGFALGPIMWMVVRDGPKEDQSDSEALDDSPTYSKLLADIKQVFQNKQIWINGLIGGLIILPTTVFAELWGPAFLEIAYNFTGEQAVKATSMIFLGWAVGAPLTGFLSDYFNRRRLPLMFGALVAMGILVWIIYFPFAPVWGVYTLLFMFGVISSVEVIAFAVARESSPNSVAGTAIAMTNFLVVCAGPFQWLVGKLLDYKWAASGAQISSYGQPIYTLESFQSALFLMPLGMLLAFILTFFLKETYGKSFDSN